MAEEKKIIVDDDWKSRAQREKEALKQKEQEEQKEQAKAEKVHTEEGKDEGAPQSRQLPEGDFSALINMLATQAMFAMGLIAEKDAKPKKDLQLAKFQIDILESLEEKTKDNLNDDETKMLESILSQLRMTFVNMAD